MRIVKVVVIISLLSVIAFGQYTILNQPAVTNRPYPKAYYNQRLPNAGSGGPLTHLMPGSDAIVNTVMHSGGNLMTQSGEWHTPGSDDFTSTPLYFGQQTDPVYQVSGCSGAGTFVNGMKFHAPSSAPYAAQGGTSDSTIAIWDQPSNNIFAFYQAGTSGALPACSGTSTSPCNFTHNGNAYCTAQNRNVGSGIQAGNTESNGLAAFGTNTRITELKDVGHINHGLLLFTWCNDTANGLYPSRTVFPIGPGGGAPAEVCGLGYASTIPATNRPPNGALFFLDYTQAQLDCFDPSKAPCTGINKMTPLQFAHIEAMTLYGGTLFGTGGGNSIAFTYVEGMQSYYFYDTHGYSGARAIADAFQTYMNDNCTGSTCNITTRSAPHSLIQWNLSLWAGISLVGGKDVAGHMHIADPCVAMGLQGVAGGCVSGSTPSAPLPPSGLAVATT